MNSLDLDINNYELKDILKLFKVSYDLTIDDMKKAKKIVLMSHPDKSRMSPDIFLFYTKAYKILYYLYQFRNNQTNTETEYNPNIEDIKRDTTQEKEIRSFSKSSMFNKQFNKIFDENRMTDDDVDTGYKEWLSGSENLNTYSAKNVSQMNSVIEEKKREARNLVVHSDFEPLESSSNYDLTRNRPTYYSSDIFSKLPYEDLKTAHTETLIPVNEEDYNNKKKYANIQEYNEERKQNIEIISQQQSENILNQKRRTDEENANRIAYQLLQSQNEAEKNNSIFMSKLNRITNK